jgi:cytochrome c biogenesis protein CcmG, thiol:disulfide interchange protein DsbE
LNHNRQRMARNTRLTLGIVLGAALVGLVVWGIASGGEEDADSGAGNPESKAIDYEAALADAPPELAKLYENGDEIIPGGGDAFQAQLEGLRGYPVVVNVWASWCGPCRLEFPDFQAVAADRGDEVAFLGVDTDDSTDAANDFLAELPLPYPSIDDPESDVKEELELVGLPGTAYYDEQGELVHVKQGPYLSEAELEADIDKYLG